MLKSYEARTENGQIQWLAEQPQFTSARIILTVLEEETSPPVKRRMPALLVGKVKILCDIVGPIVSEDEWSNQKIGRAIDIFGIVTNSRTWQFYNLTPDNLVYATLPYAISDLEAILGQIHRIFHQYQQNLQQKAI